MTICAELNQSACEETKAEPLQSDRKLRNKINMMPGWKITISLTNNLGASLNDPIQTTLDICVLKFGNLIDAKVMVQKRLQLNPFSVLGNYKTSAMCRL